MDPVLQDDGGVAALQAQIAALEAAGSYAEAIPLAERHAEAARARFGEEHPAYAAALAALARLLRHVGSLDEAEALLRGAIAVYGKGDGGHALELARTYGLLAQVLSDAGRADEAEALRGYALTAGPPDEAFGAGAPGAAAVDGPSAERDERERDAGAAGFAKVPASGPAAPPPPPAAKPASPPPASPAVRAPAPQALDGDRVSAARRRAEPEAPPDASHRKVGPRPREKVDAKRALEIDAGRIAYQIPRRMWLNLQETVEVRLGRKQVQGLAEGFGGRGEVKTADIPIVETMSVSLMCEPGAFDIVPRSERDQLVKPDLVLGTPLHSADFGRWVWLVTPRQSGEHKLLVKVTAAIRDSRGLPTTSSLPDQTFAVTVRVRIVRMAVSALLRAAPGLAWAVATTLVGIFTKDYWWPAIRRLIGWE
jgi:Tetratricopeptide repeat